LDLTGDGLDGDVSLLFDRFAFGLVEEPTQIERRQIHEPSKRQRA
jgi:hypothetical protein